jgi:hypothetical protein
MKVTASGIFYQCNKLPMGFKLKEYVKVFPGKSRLSLQQQETLVRVGVVLGYGSCNGWSLLQV